MLETRQSGSGQSQSGCNKVSQTANENKHQTDIEISVSVNFDKVNKIISNNKKRDYKELYGIPDIPSSSKKRSYEELFGDISDFLDIRDVSGVIIDR